MKIFDEVYQERAYQDQKWGGPEHDATHTDDEWRELIRQFAAGERGRTYRSRMIKCAALALASIEASRRRFNIPIDREKIMERSAGLSIVCPLDEGEQSQRVIAQSKTSMYGVIAQCLFYVNRLDDAELRREIERVGEIPL